MEPPPLGIPFLELIRGPRGERSCTFRLGFGKRVQKFRNVGLCIAFRLLIDKAGDFFGGHISALIGVEYIEGTRDCRDAESEAGRDTELREATREGGANGQTADEEQESHSVERVGHADAHFVPKR